MKRTFVILLSALLLIPSLSYAYVDPASNALLAQWLIYVAIIIVLHIVLGIASRSINQSKGYEGGFAWGFWLGIIGIIVVACKANKNTQVYEPNISTLNTVSDTNTKSQTTELERLAKLHASGALSDAEFTEAKQKLISKM